MSTHELVIDKVWNIYLRCNAKVTPEGTIPSCWYFQEEDGSLQIGPGCKAVEWIETVGFNVADTIVVPVRVLWQGEDGPLLMPIKEEQQ